MRSELLKCCAVLFVLVGCVQIAEAQKLRVVLDATSANILSIKKAHDLPEGDLANRIEKDGRGKKLLPRAPIRSGRRLFFASLQGRRKLPLA